MKNAAMIIVSAIMGFLILGIVLTIGGSMNRRCEVETILPSAMEKTVEGMPFAEAGGSSGELVIAECVELLAAEIDTDSDVVLKVYQNDVQKGVLSMKLPGKVSTSQWNGRYGRSGQNNHSGAERESAKRSVPGAVLPEPGGNARGGELL